jgi:hypothetical protein
MMREEEGASRHRDGTSHMDLCHMMAQVRGWPDWEVIGLLGFRLNSCKFWAQIWGTFRLFSIALPPLYTAVRR